MSAAAKPDMNVKQVVPFFRIADMDRSIRFYMHGLGFTVKHKWVVDEKLRWCWLELGGAALMLQTYMKEEAHTWTPPENFEPASTDVILSIANGASRELLHSFRIALRGEKK